MAQLIAILARWLAHKLGVLLLILLVLLAGAWIRTEWKRIAEDKEALVRKERLLEGLADDLQRLEAGMADKESAWKRMREEREGTARAALAEIDQQIRQTGEEWKGKVEEFSDLDKAAEAAVASATAARRRSNQLGREVGWWQRGTAPLSNKNRDKVLAYETARATAELKERAAAAAVATRDALGKVLETSPIKQLQAARQEQEEEQAAAAALIPEEERIWREQRARKVAEIAESRALIEEQQQRIAGDPRQRFLAAVTNQLPTAAWILLGIILAPVAVKAAFYYIFAPLAARLPPIRILPGEAPAIPEPERSAVSLPFEITADEEILVHPDFLQSSSQPALKRTQWLLNYRLPFSSIASGMFLLTRIHPHEADATRVVLSSQKDALGEIGVLELPEGAAMVVQPRSLAGVIKPRGAPVAITRHWRLGSPHAWLTLQLRYLVFHGPCRLVLKGCRGVRAEQPDPERPRMINQAATIGFSANLSYHNTRCETFISYLRGKEDLFNDLFAGGPGRFVYEEMPAGGRKTGLAGRGLEGFLDSTLKVFGL